MSLTESRGSSRFCESCGAPSAEDICKFCGTKKAKQKLIISTIDNESFEDPEDLFDRKLYADCAKTCQEILRIDRDNLKARLFSGVVVIFKDPNDLFSIDRNLYFLLIDRVTSPVGELGNAFATIKSVIAESVEIADVLSKSLKEYYKTREAPSNYSSSYANTVMNELQI